MSQVKRVVRVKIDVEQKGPESYSSRTLASQEITLPSDLSDGKVAAIVASQISSMRDLVDAAHGPVPADVDTVEVATSF